MKKEIQTIISKDSVFKGNLNLKNSVRIEGHFHGNIRSQKDAHITSTAIVKSDIFAQNVTIEGQLTGNVEALKSILITSTGNVKGSIKSPNLKVEDGSITYAKLIINENKVKSLE